MKTIYSIALDLLNQLAVCKRNDKNNDLLCVLVS